MRTPPPLLPLAARQTAYPPPPSDAGVEGLMRFQNFVKKADRRFGGNRNMDSAAVGAGCALDR